MSWDTKIKEESNLNYNFLVSAGIQTLHFLDIAVKDFHFIFDILFVKLSFFFLFFLFTVLWSYGCTVCHWLRWTMKLIYCVTRFPSLCYMTWGVHARINLFTVACSCFVSISSSTMQVSSKKKQKKTTDLKKTKEKKNKTKKKQIFLVLEMFMQVCILKKKKKSIVFKQVGVKDVCATFIFVPEFQTHIIVLSGLLLYQRLHLSLVSCDF